MNPDPLREMCIEKCAYNFMKIPIFNYSDLSHIHKYIFLAYPFLHEIAAKCHYQHSYKLTLIFLPYLIRKGKLQLTDHNTSSSIQWIEQNKEMTEMMKMLTCLSINAPEGRDYFKLLSLTPKMSNLRVLQLCTWTTDDILAALGVFCPHLEVLDAREDTASSVTDAGLGFLSQCKKLNLVLFSNIADEYDYEDKLRFTGKGIAMLLLTLPLLSRIETPEYLLRDALQYIYQMNFRRFSLSLTCLLLGFPGVPARTISVIPYLCPKIDTLSVYISSNYEMMIANSLRKLIHLKRLVLSLEGCRKICELGLPEYGPQLEFLYIKTHFLSEEDIISINHSCSNLNILVLQMHSFTYEPLSIENSGILFKHLDTLEFLLRAPLQLFIFLNSKVSSIQALYCQYAAIRGLEDAIRTIVRSGGWPRLEVLVLPNTVVLTLQFLMEVVNMLPNLRVLAATLPDPSEETKFRQYLMLNKLKTKFLDYDDLPPPSRRIDQISVNY